MNRIIKELIEQCTTFEKGPVNQDVTENTVIERFDRNKFAQLLVSRCAGAAEVYIGDSRISEYLEYKFGVDDE